MIDLSKIDLISINCVNPEQSVKALLYSSEKIKFGSIKLFSHEKPSNLPDNFEFIKTEKFTHETINWFALNQLPRFISNDFIISIQEDGFIINPNNWDDNFLNYDYIGAPWPPLPWCQKNRVGNGGFVLYSKKFLNYCLGIKEKTTAHNDVVITNTYYDYFILNGCKYAPIEVASKFSLEHKIPECDFDLSKTFGFHGKLHDQCLKYIELLKKYDYNG